MCLHQLSLQTLLGVLADGQPVWRNVSKAPAPKYTQQTDAALGGPFERTGSTQLPRAGSTQLPRANSAKTKSRTKPASRQGSRPKSAKDQAPNSTAAVTAANTQEPQLIQEQQLFLPFQSRIPAAPSQPASAEPDTSRITASDDRAGTLLSLQTFLPAACLQMD